MINHLSGRLVEKTPAYIIIECAGVGYYVNISLHTYSKLPDDEQCRIFTHLQINEDAHTLFGFADEEERKLFRQLISISGVGAGTARMMLSSMNPHEIQEAIVNEDAKRLQAIKGIGEKSAQRIILELKGKLKKEPQLRAMTTNLRVKDEAMSALMTLGFNKQAVDKVVDNLVKQQPSISVEDLIRQALKTL
jgi:holliday junction DNA helicase RuvA